MKNIKNILFGLVVIVAAGLFNSCAKDDTSPVLKSITPSVLDGIPVNYFVLTPVEGQNPFVLTVTWIETKFSVDDNLPVAPVTYTLEADTVGNNFAHPVAIGASPDLSVNILTNDINDILRNNFVVEAEKDTIKAVTLELRVKTTFGQASQATVIPSETVYSTNTITVTFVSFPIDLAVPPVYLIGNMNTDAGGNWNNSDISFPMYRADNKTGVFTYTGKFAADVYFKIMPQKNLGTWVMYHPTDNSGTSGTLKLENQDPAFHIVSEGYYTLTIDVNAMTWKLEPYDVTSAPVYNIMGFIGDFSGWDDAATVMSNVISKGNNTPDATDLHNWTWTGNVGVTGYGVKFRANHSWNDKWCPSVPKNNPYGVAVYNPTDQDNNIDITAQGTGDYQVWFNDLTGHYIVKRK